MHLRRLEATPVDPICEHHYPAEEHSDGQISPGYYCENPAIVWWIETETTPQAGAPCVSLIGFCSLHADTYPSRFFHEYQRITGDEALAFQVMVA